MYAYSVLYFPEQLVAAKKEDGGVETEKNMGEAWWAALASRNPCLSNSSRKN